jgi:hypothetical protein
MCTWALGPDARAQGDEKLVQLLERLAEPTRTPGGDGTVESFLRGIEVVHDDQRLATSVFEGHRGDGPPSPPSSLVQTRRECGVTSTYLPKNSAWAARRHRGRTPNGICPPTRASLAGSRTPHRLRYPPPLEQLGPGPGLEHDARRAVEGSRDDQLAVRLPFHRRAVLPGAGSLSLLASIDSSPSVSVPRQPCPTRRSVRPRAGGTSRSTPSLPPVGAGRAAGPHAPDLLRGDEPRLLQDADVLLHAGEGHVELLGKVRDRSVGSRPSCSRTPRRVASESAANEVSRRVVLY